CDKSSGRQANRARRRRRKGAPSSQSRRDARQGTPMGGGKSSRSPQFSPRQSVSGNSMAEAWKPRRLARVNFSLPARTRGGGALRAIAQILIARPRPQKDQCPPL